MSRLTSVPGALRLASPALLVCLTVHGLSAADDPPLFPGLTPHSRPFTTRSATAQRYFDQGLGFLYAFNHAEAIRSFEAAARHDPAAAMPWWAIAYAHGPHINFPLVDETHAAAAWDALTRARERAPAGTTVEQALITALEKRYANPQPEDRLPLDRAYADAMRDLWKQHANDADVGALFAESLMNLRPWDLWSRDGQPHPETIEVVQVLEQTLRLAPEHPLALHLYIHAIEGSPHPERAEAVAETLRRQATTLGHLVHMPSHIDVRLGRWSEAIATNERAAAADKAYRESVPEQDFYRTYMAHNHHMRAFAAMMQGRSEMATEAIRTLLDEMPEEWVRKNPMFVDAYFAMPYELHLRFGRWQPMLEEPEPPADLPVARAVRLYARGIARAALHDSAGAREEQTRFRTARDLIPEEAVFVLNKAADVLAVADQMLEGEILYREGKVEESLAALRRAVELEEGLRYIEPPDWIQPVRHALGATLSDAGRWAEAEAVYRDDLKVYPRNGWSLYGLAQALRKQGRTDEATAVEQQFRAAWQSADLQLSSSCLCVPGRK